MRTGARNYRAHVRSQGKEGTAYVKTLPVFLGPKCHFMDYQQQPKSAAGGSGGKPHSHYQKMPVDQARGSESQEQDPKEVPGMPGAGVGTSPEVIEEVRHFMETGELPEGLRNLQGGGQ